MEKMVDGLPSGVVKFCNYQIKNRSEGGWTMKRIAWCVAVMMLLVCVGAWALAEEGEVYSDGGYEYVLLEDGSAKITLFMGPEETDEVEIPGELDGHTVTAMASQCFELWNLTSVTIPDSVTEIEGNPFFVCESLQTIEVSPNHPALALIDGVLFDKTEKKLLCYPAGREDTSYEIPEGIVAIGWGAFSNCMRLEHVSIPETVAAIGDYAFYACYSLRSADVPDGVTAIGEGTFAYCKALEDVSLPDSVESIGQWAFDGCYSLTQIRLPDGVSEIGPWAFREELVLTVGRDSYAMQYAEENGLQYTYPDANDWLYE